ncbi:hypothetical protein K469DRAFT_658487 [Zopfia rhizophila CBS 207.26]|uniref:N-acetyltransferase domain-containing protein n=1 Tax=Zopfia rhizophila CBS 207.26 TaxID=1314779 RepID=A0A6A6EI60_9PEZI|nr:hypothetical protein K469DRAFT_658487 [Zopfia rhizophila CBS 207.26]
MTITYTITLLPKDYPDPSTWDEMISRQKDLRLLSLQIAPDSFSSTFSRESQFTREDWEARLKNPQAFTFIASPSSNSKSSPAPPISTFKITQEPWIGSAVLLGPLPLSTNPPSHPSTKASGRSELRSEENHITFEICALFVMPEARRLGVGNALFEAVIVHGKSIARERGCSLVCFRVSTAESNKEALRLYEKLGFKVVARNNFLSGSTGAGSCMRGTLSMELWSEFGSD